MKESTSPAMPTPYAPNAKMTKMVVRTRRSGVSSTFTAVFIQRKNKRIGKKMTRDKGARSLWRNEVL